MRATIVDLRYRMKSVLAALDCGETVIVFHRGKEKATLTPISSPLASKNKGPKTLDQALFGLWSDRAELADPASYVRDLRQSRRFSNESITEGRSGRKQRK